MYLFNIVILSLCLSGSAANNDTKIAKYDTRIAHADRFLDDLFQLVNFENTIVVCISLPLLTHIHLPLASYSLSLFLFFLSFFFLSFCKENCNCNCNFFMHGKYFQDISSKFLSCGSRCWLQIMVRVSNLMLVLFTDAHMGAGHMRISFISHWWCGCPQAYRSDISKCVCPCVAVCVCMYACMCVVTFAL